MVDWDLVLIAALAEEEKSIQTRRISSHRSASYPRVLPRHRSSLKAANAPPVQKRSLRGSAVRACASGAEGKQAIDAANVRWAHVLGAFS
ncbi:unnamed protein product [Pieris brassicae]|uniref:Uncharacterized protein n=1 Tax=Pieris brassicae TaxID=7116 RepID=A0A9P0XE58_PIEBR|nr:unnamed protein product [Pieris brassicae]